MEMIVGVVFIVLPFMVWFGLFLLNGDTSDNGFQAEEYWKVLMVPSALRYMPEMVDGMQFDTWKDYAGNLIGVWLCLLGTICIFPMIVKQFIGFHKPTEDEWKKLMTPQQKKD